MDELIEVMLDECISEFRESAEYYNNSDYYKEKEYAFPTSAIVVLHDRYSRKPFTVGNALRAWEMTVDNISELDSSFINNRRPGQLHQSEPRSGSFFKQGTYQFAVDIEKRKICFFYVLGPLNGATFLYDIDDDGERKTLSNKKMTAMA